MAGPGAEGPGLRHGQPATAMKTSLDHLTSWLAEGSTSLGPAGHARSARPDRRSGVAALFIRPGINR